MRFMFALAILVLVAGSAMASEIDSPLSIGSVRIVLNKEGDTAEVEQTFRLIPNGETDIETKGYRIGLPEGARGATLPMEKGKAVSVNQSEIVVTGIIPTSGRAVAVRYTLPISDGAVDIKQNLGHGAESVQAISTWTMGDAALKGKGFGDAEKVAMQGGITVLIATATGLSNGEINLRLSGLAEGPERMMQTVSLGLAALILVLGLVFWLRRRAG